MPQMAPINWLSLYVLFLTVFLIFIILNFYSFTYLPKTIKSSKSNISLTWKW